MNAPSGDGSTSALALRTLRRRVRTGDRRRIHCPAERHVASRTSGHDLWTTRSEQRNEQVARDAERGWVGDVALRGWAVVRALANALAEATHSTILREGDTGQEDRRLTRRNDAVAVRGADRARGVLTELRQTRHDARGIGLEQDLACSVDRFHGHVEALDDRGANAARDGALCRIQEELGECANAARVRRERRTREDGLVDRDVKHVREGRLGRGHTVGATNLNRATDGATVGGVMTTVAGTPSAEPGVPSPEPGPETMSQGTAIVGRGPTGRSCRAFGVASCDRAEGVRASVRSGQAGLNGRQVVPCARAVTSARVRRHARRQHCRRAAAGAVLQSTGAGSVAGVDRADVSVVTRGIRVQAASPESEGTQTPA